MSTAQHKHSNDPILNRYHKQVAEIDLTGEHGKKVFCTKLAEALSPLTFILRLVGRFPLRKKHADIEAYEYEANPILLIHFHVTSVLLVLILGLTLYSAVLVATESPGKYLRSSSLSKLSKQTQEDYELQLGYDHVLMQRNGIPLIIIYTTLAQALAHSFILTFRTSYLAHIFTFLNRVAYALHMDVGEKVKEFCVRLTVGFIIFTAVLIMLSALKFGPTAYGAPMVFGSMIVRPFYEIIQKVNVYAMPSRAKWLSHLLVRSVGGTAIVFIYVCAIGPILLFAFTCKVLRNGFALWNARVYCILLRGNEHAQTTETRTTFNLLFKDHCVLLDLLESINRMYAYILESYFVFQLLSLMIQIYLIMRTVSQKVITKLVKPFEKDAIFYARPYDWVPAILIFVASSMLLFCAGHAAHDVATEAQAGQEVIRRKGMLGRKTDQELEFMFNMNFSFQSYQTIQTDGAGWFTYNNSFLYLLIGQILFYLALIQQFRILWDYNSNTDNFGNQNSSRMGMFLKESEGHYDHKDKSGNASTDYRIWSLAF